jgi:hypothetical protein
VCAVTGMLIGDSHRIYDVVDYSDRPSLGLSSRSARPSRIR